MSGEMEKTVKLVAHPDHKSVPVRCDRCGELVKIVKRKMDDKETTIDHKICYSCFKKELRQMSDVGKGKKKKK